MFYQVLTALSQSSPRQRTETHVVDTWFDAVSRFGRSALICYSVLRAKISGRSLWPEPSIFLVVRMLLVQGRNCTGRLHQRYPFTRFLSDRQSCSRTLPRNQFQNKRSPFVTLLNFAARVYQCGTLIERFRATLLSGARISSAPTAVYFPGEICEAFDRWNGGEV